MKTIYLSGIAICSGILVGCGGGAAAGIFGYVAALPGSFANSQNESIFFDSPTTKTEKQTTTATVFNISMQTGCLNDKLTIVFNGENFTAYSDSKQTLVCLQGKFVATNSISIEYKNKTGQTLKAENLVNKSLVLELANSIWRDQKNQNHYFKIKSGLNNGSTTAYAGCEIINGAVYSTITRITPSVDIPPNPYVESNGNRGYFNGYGRISFSSGSGLILDRVANNPAIPACP